VVAGWKPHRLRQPRITPCLDAPEQHQTQERAGAGGDEAGVPQENDLGFYDEQRKEHVWIVGSRE
jgi:hypothetical protein